MAKDHIALARKAKRQGFRQRVNSGGHQQLVSPNGSVTTLSPQLGHGRARQNTLKSLERGGFTQQRGKRRVPSRAPNGNGLVVLEALQQTPNTGTSITELMSRTGLIEPQVRSALQALRRKHPEIHSERQEDGRALYKWTPMEDGRPFTEEATEEEPLAKTTAAITELFLQPAVEVEVPETTNVIRVVPAALPEGTPTLFEGVTVDGQGRIILKDEHGNIWCAARMKIH